MPNGNRAAKRGTPAQTVSPPLAACTVFDAAFLRTLLQSTMAASTIPCNTPTRSKW